ncbi:MAG: formate dehydrogenase accessory sulfurtransferase FdhD [Coriobacteriia bacterium]|nr:formate dehydrogenase accessory sulfurtransferase FdhD [Coriobacteriia bacterium]
MGRQVASRIPVTAAVLAGGRSLRMGIDKTLLSVEGEPLVVRVTESVGDVCAHTVIVTNRPEALEEIDLPAGVRVLQDTVAYQGPLGGLATALEQSEDEWVLAVAADMPWLRPELVRALWDARDGAQVVIPVSSKGAEPLLALYHVSCLPAARAVLESGRRRLIAMLPSLKVVEVPVESLRDVDPELRSLVNVNTPEELADVRANSPISAREESSAVRLSVIEVGTRRTRGMPSERPVTVMLNDVEIATIQATPADLEEMAVGFLMSEGLITRRDALGAVDVDHKRGHVYVASEESVPEDFRYRERYVTAGCGKGITFASVAHASGIEPVVSDMTISSRTLYGLMGQMARLATAYRDTGGMQSCALACDGVVTIMREDVGRHNALDKVLGRAWLDGTDTTGCVLLTTGRVSYEMAVKAAKARIPVVVSRTAVTDLAADIGARVGISIVGYARGGKLVVYTHPERIIDEEDEDS